MKFEIPYDNLEDYLKAIRGLFNLTDKEIELLLLLLECLNGDEIITKEVKKEWISKANQGYQLLQNRLSAFRKKEVIISGERINPILLESNRNITILYEEKRNNTTDS